MALVLDTKQSEVRCLDLWNGSSNNAVPSGWHLPNFDDSGWSFSAKPTLSNENGGFPVVSSAVWLEQKYNPSQFDDPRAALPDGLEAIWPTSTPRNPGQYAIFRWHFVWPSTYTITDQINFGPSVLPFFGDNGALYINGHAVPNFDSFGSITALRSLLAGVIVPGDNVFAVGVWGSHFNPGTGGHDESHLAWVNSAWFAVRYILAAGGARAWAAVIG